MNNVILIGRLTRDPELSYTPNTQTAVCRFTIAVDRPKRNGENQGADFIRITVWSRQAETCDRYLSKGRQVAVMGSIQTGSYKDRNGETVYTTDVVASRVEFLGGVQDNSRRSESDGMLAQTGPVTAETLQGGFMDLPDSFQTATDDIPY